MPYTIHAEGGVLWAALHGTVTGSELHDLLEAVAAIEAVQTPVQNRIIDFTAIDDLAINFADVSVLARRRTARHFANAFKSALVAPGLVHFGFARMWQTMTAHSQIRVAVFPTTAEALQWVSLPGVDLPDAPWEPPLTGPSPSTSP